LVEYLLERPEGPLLVRPGFNSTASLSFSGASSRSSTGSCVPRVFAFAFVVVLRTTDD